jgi:single-strand selective monofunctional uracil DNA glycosylase
MPLTKITRRLVDDVRRLRFGPPVAFVYNPLEYAARPHLSYVTNYARVGIEALFVGMNPGPWGMAQTGVPFGEVGMVRDWLGICEPVGKPKREHPKRPVEGFACGRREVSGTRLWGWARDTLGTPKQFFSRFFVANYCPLCFLEESGRNLTPDKLPLKERKPLLAACDRALRDTVAHLKPQRVVGIGRFAQDRAREALADFKLSIGRISHPSPASPVANRGWAKQIVVELKNMGIELPGSVRRFHVAAGRKIGVPHSGQTADSIL